MSYWCSAMLFWHLSNLEFHERIKRTKNVPVPIVAFQTKNLPIPIVVLQTKNLPIPIVTHDLPCMH